MIGSNDFIFNGKRASTDYGLIVCEFGKVGSDEINIGAKREVIEDRIYRTPKPLYYNVVFDGKLELEFTVMNSDWSNMSANKVREVTRWLVSPRRYLWFTMADSAICEDLNEAVGWSDLEGDPVGATVPWYGYSDPVTHSALEWQELSPDGGTNYHLIVTDVQPIIYGGVAGLRVSAECDSPYAWSNEKTVTISSDSESTASTQTIEVNADGGEFVFPAMSVSGSSATDLSIKNVTDSNRTMEYDAIPLNLGSVSINCERQIVVPPSGGSIGGFNFTFLRLMPGENTIESKGIFTATLTYREPIMTSYV